jgi:hypothetical protein
VQVQSKAKTGAAAKLGYIKRGPYKIVESYAGGSYKLAPLVGRSQATIKQHGSDLYLSPQSLVPHKPILSSDQASGDLQEKTISNPYQLVALDGYEASRPWSAPAATLQIQLAVLSHIPDFPAVQELDNEFDRWPELGNPFVDRDITNPVETVKDGILSLSASIRTKSSIVADLLRSEDKLFFIAYSQEKAKNGKNVSLRAWISSDLFGSIQTAYKTEGS